MRRWIAGLGMWMCIVAVFVFYGVTAFHGFLEWWPIVPMIPLVIGVVFFGQKAEDAR